MAWKVVVDFDLCESNAICMGIVPEVFEVRDDDFLYVSAWQFKGDNAAPELHKEPLVYEEVKLATRSYK